MENYAIKIQGVKKQYRLGQIGGGTLTADLQSWWARVRGKEDPNIKLDQDQRLIGQTFMALNGIDLTIYQGEAVGIIGHNGAGKSTLLKLLSRVTAPTAGTIDINGRIASMLEVGTGFSPEMTGRENVYLNGTILGMTKAEVDSKMDQIIEFSEIGEFIDTPVKRYSSGMYVKLAFSVAAHLDSEIMIMDEVLAVGDVNFQQKCIKKMKESACIDGRTVLYVSHNMNTIRELCDRCIVLDKGRIVHNGEVEEGIDIYLNCGASELKNDIDLSDIKRAFETPGIIKMKKISIISNNFSLDSKLQFTLELHASLPMKNVILRVVLFNNQSAIGATYSQLFDLNSDDNLVSFVFDTSYLAPGKYTADIIVCDYNSGIQTRQDILTQVFSFIINETEIRYNMMWNKRGWGPIRFPEIKVMNDG